MGGGGGSKPAPVRSPCAFEITPTLTGDVRLASTPGAWRTLEGAWRVANSGEHFLLTAAFFMLGSIYDIPCNMVSIYTSIQKDVSITATEESESP